MAVSTQDGMGPRNFKNERGEEITGFRVWAPFARSVAVGGTFNNWSKDANPLTREDSGNWSVDIPGAKVGDEYKYYLIDAYGTPRWRNDPRARELSRDPQNSVIHDSEIGGPNFDWEGDDFQIPNWNELVIYEMHIGTFNPGSPDSTEKFESAAEKLPYLRALGINCVEIMAAGEFPGQFSWGYNPAYIFAIESSYGGVKGFKEFVKAAHQNEIAVIFDVIYNHIGGDALDMWQFDGWNQDGLGGIYFYNDWRHDTGFGDRPDYGRGEVRTYIKDNAMTWLQKRHVDGLRLDATAFIRNVYGNDNDPAHDVGDGWSLVKWINEAVNAEQGKKIVIAEDLKRNPWITKSPGAGGMGCDSQWDVQFQRALRSAVMVGNDADRNVGDVAKAISYQIGSDAFDRVIYSESHDDVSFHSYGNFYRIPEEIWPGKADSWASKKRSTLAAGLVFTSPGIPMIFQGQEFLESGHWDEHNLLDWDKASRFGGIVNLYRDLIHLRRNWFNNTRGLRGQYVHVYHSDPVSKVIAFHRWADGGPGDDVVVVANFTDKTYDNYPIGFPRGGLWHVRFNSDSNSYSSDFDNHFTYDTEANGPGMQYMPCSAHVGIGKYSLVIFSQ